MILFKKVIKIDVVQKVDYPDSLGMVSLYPKGTKRTIKVLTFTGWKFINDKNPKDIGSANLMHTYPILMSGKFKEVESNIDDKYFEYILID